MRPEIVNHGQASIEMGFLLEIEDRVNGQIAHWVHMRRMLGWSSFIHKYE